MKTLVLISCMSLLLFGIVSCRDDETYTREIYQTIAENFVENSPTFQFDGIGDSLNLVETKRFDVKGYWLWEFVFAFDCRHAGFGDRTGENLLQVITPHIAVIRVEREEITSAVLDDKWNMINQKVIE